MMGRRGKLLFSWLKQRVPAARDEVNLTLRRDADGNPRVFCCGDGSQHLSPWEEDPTQSLHLGTCNLIHIPNKEIQGLLNGIGDRMGNKVQSLPDPKCPQVEALPEEFLSETLTPGHVGPPSTNWCCRKIFLVEVLLSHPPAHGLRETKLCRSSYKLG